MTKSLADVDVKEYHTYVVPLHDTKVDTWRTSVNINQHEENVDTKTHDDDQNDKTSSNIIQKSTSRSPIPPYTHLNDAGNGWECNRGYVKSGSKCSYNFV